MSDETKRIDDLVFRANLFWEGFYRCPTTGRIVEGAKGDDKVFCGCGKHHQKRVLQKATAREYVLQHEAGKPGRSP